MCWCRTRPDTPNPRSICASYRIIITIIIKKNRELTVKYRIGWIKISQLGKNNQSKSANKSVKCSSNKQITHELQCEMDLIALQIHLRFYYLIYSHIFMIDHISYPILYVILFVLIKTWYQIKFLIRS
jgi:hypothetical protein